MKTLRRIGVKRITFNDRTLRYRIADLDEAREERSARTLARANKPPPYLNISLKAMRKLLIARVYVTDRTFRYRSEDLERWVKGHSV